MAKETVVSLKSTMRRQRQSCKHVRQSLPEALEFLEIANINEYSVFPDMSGIADYVRRSARLE